MKTSRMPSNALKDIRPCCILGYGFSLVDLCVHEFAIEEIEQLTEFAIVSFH
jgi:hypothetical protein